MIFFFVVHFVCVCVLLAVVVVVVVERFTRMVIAPVAEYLRSRNAVWSGTDWFVDSLSLANTHEADKNKRADKQIM